MRVLLEENSKKDLLLALKSDLKCDSLKALSEKLKINKKTLEGWFYLKKSIPSDFLKRHGSKINFKIFKELNDNWGQVAGGKKGYSRALRKYGSTGMRNIQSLGGKRGAETKDLKERNIKIDLNDKEFLEIYGALIGDGWLNNPANPKSRWGIGLCGNLHLDKTYVLYCRNIVEKLFNRKGYLKEKEEGNVIEFIFKHKWLFKLLNERLGFPAGRKHNLKIHSSLYSLDYEKVKYIIRGIFDTDGSFYLSRNRRGIPSYPCISIHMKEPILMNQLFNVLHKNGFRLSFERENNQIRIKGKDQLKKWVNEIGSSNPKHMNKISSFISKSF